VPTQRVPPNRTGVTFSGSLLAENKGNRSHKPYNRYGFGARRARQIRGAAQTSHRRLKPASNAIPPMARAIVEGSGRVSLTTQISLSAVVNRTSSPLPHSNRNHPQAHLLQLATRVGRNLLIPNKAMPANAKS